MKPTLYDMLGVERTATQAEIKLAYRTFAKATHPDVGGVGGPHADRQGVRGLAT
jgi:curved DNA-binding protein CbpA